MKPSRATRLSLLLLLGCVASCDKKAERADEMMPAEAKVAAEGDYYAEEALAEPSKKEKAKDGDGDDAETQTWKRSEIVPNTSRLEVGDDTELPITGMQTRVRIDGFRARVLIDYYFFNADAQQYEGNFTVRLPTGASPYFLAFGQSKVAVGTAAVESEPRGGLEAVDALPPESFDPGPIMQRRLAGWIEPKEARVVPKEQAAHAYTETVRRRVDPALMEWAGPGMFNARIFPIAPNKVHRVVIAYDADLTPIGGDYEFRVPLPEGVAQQDVHIAVQKSDGMEVAVSPDGASDDSPETAYYTFDQPKEREITVRLKGAGNVALTGADEIGPYFAAQFEPELPAQKAASGRPDAVFLVDTSMSSNPDRFNVWRALMKAVLEENRGDLKRFAVMFYNVESHWWRPAWSENTPENVGALLRYADTLALEGATDLGQALSVVASSEAISLERSDLFLLSDAAVTWGTSDRYQVSRRLEGTGVPVFAYRTGMAGDDTAMLEHLTRETGGAVFSVVGESEIAAAAKAHRQRPWTIRRVQAEGLADPLLAGRPKTYFPGQRLTLAARGVPASKVELVLRRGDAEQTVAVPIDHTFESSLTTRTYGQIAVGQLEEVLDWSTEFAEAYARHYRVPGESSSLVMLESQSDYEAYGIVPKDDAQLVKMNLAGETMLRALDAMFQRLGKPKDALTSWLERAEKMPGVQLSLPAELVAALDALPASSFEVRPEALDVKRRDWDAVSSQLAKQLGKQKPDYDFVSAEAQSRKQTLGGADALKALSSLIEANPGDGTLARDVAYAASSWGYPGQAYYLLRRVIESRPYEPLTYHSTAKALAKAKSNDLALLYYEVALRGQWASRFGEFRKIVELDYLRFLRIVGPPGVSAPLRDWATNRRAELEQAVDVEGADVVVAISWNTDRTDIDLHVIEPSGEECYYEHPNTKSGGRLTRDVTTGYGPEMYVLEKAPKGRYQVKVKYYASDANRAGTRTKVHATIYENWGSPNERVTEKVVTLRDSEELQDVASLKK